MFGAQTLPEHVKRFMSEFRPESGLPLAPEEVVTPAGEDLGVRWMIALKKQDESAFQNLLRQFGGKAFAVCLRILCDQQAAEDVLSEVFWEIWQNPERYDSSRSSPQTYILLIARSRAIDRLRSLGRKGSLVVDNLAPYLESNSVDPIGSPEDKISTKEESQLVRTALGRLNVTEREVLELSFFEGLSHQQIADRLQSPLGTVKSRIRQGLSHLRAKLSSTFPERNQE